MKTTYVQNVGLMGVLAVFVTLLMFALPNVAGAATFTVTSNADAGTSTLRQAIIDANNNPGPDTINFSGCPLFISLSSLLPRILDPGTTIDGSGCDVTIDGSSLAGNMDGLRVRASDTVIRELVIQNFPRDGVRIHPDTNSGETVTGVVIDGNKMTGNLDGLLVSGGFGPNNDVEATIKDNRLEDNADDGVVVVGSFGNNNDGGNTVAVTVEENLVRGNQGTTTGGTLTGDGIRVFGGAGSSGQGPNGGNEVSAHISKNRVLENIDDGILVAGGGSGAVANHTIDATITKNIVRENGSDASTAGNGIVVRGGTQPDGSDQANGNEITFDINRNIVRLSKTHGIVLSGGNGFENTISGSVTRNASNKNGNHGVLVVGGNGSMNDLSGVVLSKNLTHDNQLNGITVTDGSGTDHTIEDLSISHNLSTKNDNHGIAIFLFGSSSISLASLTRNVSLKNTRDGVLIGPGIPGTGSTLIEKNRASFNDEDGLDINSTGYIVKKNVAKHNVGAGIDAVGNTDGGGNVAVGNSSCNTPGCF